MVDVLLINPKDSYTHCARTPPLGMASIASHLDRNDIDVKIIDMDVLDDNATKSIRRLSPKVVCIGGTSDTRFESFRIAKDAKLIDESVTVVYGGTHASCTAQDTLERNPAIDIIVRGEAEETMLELLSGKGKGLGLKRIKGISFRHRNDVIHNPARNRIHYLDKYKLNYELLEMKNYNYRLDFLNLRASTIITSRGCRMNCSFCSPGRIWGGHVTRRTVTDVVEEIELLTSEYGYKGIKFHDPSLTYDKKRLKQICAEIKNRKLAIKWECFSRVDTLDKDTLKMMRSAGCYMVELGLESGSQRVLNTIRKGVSVNQALKTLQNVKAGGMMTKAFFIYGLPRESYNDALLTFKFIRKNRGLIERLAVSVGTIYPGTDMECFALSNGCLPINFSWSDYFSVPSYEEDFGSSPHVPKLIQPYLTYKQIKLLRSETYKEKISLALVARKLKDIGASKGVLYSLREAYKSLIFYTKYYQ